MEDDLEEIERLWERDFEEIGDGQLVNRAYKDIFDRYIKRSRLSATDICIKPLKVINNSGMTMLVELWFKISPNEPHVSFTEYLEEKGIILYEL
ncbi:unnamed protein product [Caenorhabditis bovis]|uniref:Uncharacterized protein n=1 Tax=Caenorhabditis bovis TaxID=2654633 RepID=A0A8S1EEE0_9PELO|nr:unnamed protein product [Caenorhabditis bovis]